MQPGHFKMFLFFQFAIAVTPWLVIQVMFAIDDYTKDSRPGVVWPSCSFHHWYSQASFKYPFGACLFNSKVMTWNSKVFRFYIRTILRATSMMITNTEMTNWIIEKFFNNSVGHFSVGYHHWWNSKLIDVCFNLSAQRFIVKTTHKSHTSPGLPFLVESSIFHLSNCWYGKLLDQICGKICFTRIFSILGEISTLMKIFFTGIFDTSFKQTVHPSDFENKLLPSQ